MTHAVLQGDEQFTTVQGGHFWAFHAAGLSIINPETCRIDHEVRADTVNNFLPDRWADGVYMERDDTAAGGGGYILINSGVTSYDQDDKPMGEIIVFSTASQSVLTRIPVEGGRHDYSYGVYTRKEYWVQGSGKLFLLSLSKLDSINANNKGDNIATQSIHLQETQLGLQDITNVTGVDHHDEGVIHGQVLWDEDPYLARHAYVTSSNQALYIVNLPEDRQQQAEEQQQHFPLTIFQYSDYLEPGECEHEGYYYGHGIAYASRIKHLFVQCGWRGPILELDVSQSPDNPSFVAKHNNMSGSSMQEYFEGRFVIVTDKMANKVHVIQASSTSGQASHHIDSIDVPGHPDKPSFYTTNNDDDTTIICMPLTENVNSNDRDANGTVACDVYSCGPPQSPADVASGMCLYDTNDNNKTLLRAPLNDFVKVLNGEAPYFDACPRCKTRDSYRGGDICTCTPHCGSCGTPTYNRNDLTQTGVRCLHLDSFTSTPSSTLIAGAGAVLQEPPGFWQPPCSYGWTQRSSKRGGRYMATIAHIPANSLQIIDMATQTWRCQVDLPGRPDRVLYVPPPNITTSSQDDETQWIRSGVMTVVIVLACAVIAGIIVSMAHFSKRRAVTLESSRKSGLFTTSNDLELT
jgi:hypothetical protein